MIALLGSLLGFVGSTIPEILKMFREKSDRKHELAILDRQLAQQKQGHKHRLEEINVQADISESQALYRHDSILSGVKWIDGLRSSVRPVITYCFFALFTTVKISALYALITIEDIAITQALPQIWDIETQALFAAIISFWFGQRAISKHRSNSG